MQFEIDVKTRINVSEHWMVTVIERLLGQVPPEFREAVQVTRTASPASEEAQSDPSGDAAEEAPEKPRRTRRSRKAKEAEATEKAAETAANDAAENAETAADSSTPSAEQSPSYSETLGSLSEALDEADPAGAAQTVEATPVADPAGAKQVDAAPQADPDERLKAYYQAEPSKAKQVVNAFMTETGKKRLTELSDEEKCTLLAAFDKAGIKLPS